MRYDCAEKTERGDSILTKKTDVEFCTASGKREPGDWRDELSVLSDNAD